MPERSPLMSAANTGTPAREKPSASTCSVTVLPVPVAPVTRPWRLASASVRYFRLVALADEDLAVRIRHCRFERRHSSSAAGVGFRRGFGFSHGFFRFGRFLCLGRLRHAADLSRTVPKHPMLKFNAASGVAVNCATPLRCNLQRDCQVSCDACGHPDTVRHICHAACFPLRSLFIMSQNPPKVREGRGQ